jgi:hypothetical protein
MLGNWVVPTATTRTAASDALYSQPPTAEQSMFFQRFRCILRTRGGEPALGTQQGGYRYLVDLYQQEEGEAKYFQELFHW